MKKQYIQPLTGAVILTACSPYMIADASNNAGLKTTEELVPGYFGR